MKYQKFIIGPTEDPDLTCLLTRQHLQNHRGLKPGTPYQGATYINFKRFLAPIFHFKYCLTVTVFEDPCV